MVANVIYSLYVPKFFTLQKKVAMLIILILMFYA